MILNKMIRNLWSRNRILFWLIKKSMSCCKSETQTTSLFPRVNCSIIYHLSMRTLKKHWLAGPLARRKEKIWRPNASPIVCSLSSTWVANSSVLLSSWKALTMTMCHCISGWLWGACGRGHRLIMEIWFGWSGNSRSKTSIRWSWMTRSRPRMMTVWSNKRNSWF